VVFSPTFSGWCRLPVNAWISLGPPKKTIMLTDHVETKALRTCRVVTEGALDVIPGPEPWLASGRFGPCRTSAADGLRECALGW
jgi:hypothetical protein